MMKIYVPVPSLQLRPQMQHLEKVGFHVIELSAGAGALT
jgi:hypothetical protein